jgi:sec-independent protein translocase protein TatB
MFNVGIGEIFVILLVFLVVFGPERLPEMARQAGRLIGRLHLLTQGALDQLKEETGEELNLTDLRVGSLRAQAKDYLRELMDIDAQLARTATRAPTAPCGPGRGTGTGAVRL